MRYPWYARARAPMVGTAGRQDALVTTEFTVTGGVSHRVFQISSEYGPLTIQVADVKEGERQTAGRESLRRNITVDGSNIAQCSLKSSGIRVQPATRSTSRPTAAWSCLPGAAAPPPLFRVPLCGRPCLPPPHAPLLTSGQAL